MNLFYQVFDKGMLSDGEGAARRLQEHGRDPDEQPRDRQDHEHDGRCAGRRPAARRLDADGEFIKEIVESMQADALRTLRRRAARAHDDGLGPADLARRARRDHAAPARRARGPPAQEPADRGRRTRTSWSRRSRRAAPRSTRGARNIDHILRRRPCQQLSVAVLEKMAEGPGSPKRLQIRGRRRKELHDRVLGLIHGLNQTDRRRSLHRKLYWPRDSA